MILVMMGPLAQFAQNTAGTIDRINAAIQDARATTDSMQNNFALDGRPALRRCADAGSRRRSPL
jgi:hypothetical protein